jgi:hypothetical protein
VSWAVGWFAVLGLTGWGQTGPETSFVCAPAPEAAPYTQVWAQANRCIPYHVDADVPELASEAGLALVQESFDVWSRPDCSDLSLQYFGTTRQTFGFNPTRSDNQNVVTAASTPAELAAFDDPFLLAITFASFSIETGEIFDADIVLNQTRFRFEDVTSVDACLARPEPPFDLRNALVHEIGHFIGFDHTPDRDSTMFESAPECEINKRSLNPTDLDGLCSLYPSGQGSRTCVAPPSYELENGDPGPFRNQCGFEGGPPNCTTPDQCRLEQNGGGCRAGGPSVGWGWALALSVAALLRRRRVSGR